MIKANDKELMIVNNRYNELFDYPSIGFDYVNEGAEITNFEVDDNGRVTIEGYVQYLNNQYAIRTRDFERHPRLKQDEIDYLLGRA